MSLDITIHKTILIKILKDIFTHHSLGPLVGFKGGTAAYLFYDLPRFSVDLDFDLLNEQKNDFVFQEVLKILQRYGTVKKADQKRFNLFFLLSYDEKIPDDQNIKIASIASERGRLQSGFVRWRGRREPLSIEINRRNFGSHYELKTYLGISMKIMTQEDMCAHKLVAFYQRMGNANRDLYDLWFFLEKNWPVNTAIIAQHTGMPYKDFLQKCIMSLEKMKEGHLLAGIGELRSAKQKIWVKNYLRKEALFQLKLRLANEEKG